MTNAIRTAPKICISIFYLYLFACVFLFFSLLHSFVIKVKKNERTHELTLLSLLLQLLNRPFFCAFRYFLSMNFVLSDAKPFALFNLRQCLYYFFLFFFIRNSHSWHAQRLIYGRKEEKLLRLSCALFWTGRMNKKIVWQRKKLKREREKERLKAPMGAIFCCGQSTRQQTPSVQSIHTQTLKMIDCGRIQFFKRFLRHTHTQNREKINTKKAFFCIYLFIFFVFFFLNANIFQLNVWALWSMNLPIYLISFELRSKKREKKSTPENCAMIYDNRQNTHFFLLLSSLSIACLF